MIMKQNCWDIKGCGRQKNGTKVGELGICPASEACDHDGKNGGLFAGRYCWKLAGTLCGGKVQGSFATKLTNCAVCEFFKQVKEEEGAQFLA